MLIVAALIEGFLRQIVQDFFWRLAIGWGMGGVWLAWLLCAGRNKPSKEVDPRHV